MGSGRQSLEERRDAARTRLLAASLALDEALPDTGAPPRLCVCDCPVCLSPATRRLLETTPRAAIARGPLAEYLQSVEARDIEPEEADYFAPVIFEALASANEPHPFGDHLAFKRLSRTKPRERWRPETRAAMSEAFAALAEAAPLRAWISTHRFPAPLSRFYGLDIGALCAAAEDAAADIKPVLAALDQTPPEILARAIVSWLSVIDQTAEGRWICDPRLEDPGEPPPPDLDARLRAWLGRPALRRRLEKAFFTETSEADAAALSDAHQRLIWQFGQTDGPESS